jgi:DNA-binding transcriptional ArsR family regulator
MDKHAEELLKFAAALLDLDRLRIVGELAIGNDRPASIAAKAGIGTEVLDAHLRTLVETGLVHLEEAPDGGERYSLDERALEEMSKRQFGRARELAEEPERRRIEEWFTPEEAKYIRSFTDPNGVITHLPSIHADAKLQAVLRYAVQGIEPGRVYTEREFNQALAPYTRDASSVRRYLVDYEYVERKPDGSAYRLRESGDDR